MDSFTLDKDIKTLCVTAEEFPEGILTAHQKLHSLLPKVERRHFFGISWPGADGKIVYKAAAEEMTENEAAEVGVETFTIKEGPYNSFYITDYKSDPNSISRAFDLLIAQHETDPNGYCLEWYINDKDVKCLVPIVVNNEHKLDKL